jgi:hypothetical protein|tara:strand:- start:3640 stop:3894 length:255 start_codon:yes stop_codon:yes gene_type:complete
MKYVVNKAKENPWLLLVPLLGLGSGGAALAKFGVFDPLIAPMHSIIYHQKIQINMVDSMTYDDAKHHAEEDMIDEGYWKPRGAE